MFGNVKYFSYLCYINKEQMIIKALQYRLTAYGYGKELFNRISG